MVFTIVNTIQAGPRYPLLAPTTPCLLKGSLLEVSPPPCCFSRLPQKIYDMLRFVISLSNTEPNPVVVGGSFSYSLSMPKVWHITTKLTHVHLRVVHILNPLFWIWARHVPTFLDQNTCFLRIFFCRMGGTPHPPFWEFRGIPPSTEEIHKIKFERLANHHFVTQSVPCGSVVFEQQKK